jgi:diadenosine tetraphosphate (Ap4A) HIT family hydrolase
LLLIALSLNIFIQEQNSSNMTCPFCDESIIAREKFYESTHCYGIYNHKPIVQGHIMVIPKKHYQRLHELSAEEKHDLIDSVEACTRILKKAYGIPDFSILLQDGEKAGQTVPHLHFHIAPMNGSLATRELVNLAKSKDRPLISDEEMEKEVEKLRVSSGDL